MIRSQARGAREDSPPYWRPRARSVWRHWNDTHTSRMWPDLHSGETTGVRLMRTWCRLLRAEWKREDRFKHYEEREVSSLFLADWNSLLLSQAERERGVWIGWEGLGPFCELWLSLNLQAIGGQQPADAETEGASRSGTWRRESSLQRA